MHPFFIQLTSSIVSLTVLVPTYLTLLNIKAREPAATFSGIGLAILASLCGATASMAYIFGIRTGELGRVSILTASYPLLTLILSIVFLGESITTAKIIGATCVIAGAIILGT